MTHSAPEAEIPDRDEMLAILVDAANASDSEMSVALTMPGGTVQGLLISHSKWIGLVDDAVTRANESMAGVFKGFAPPASVDDAGQGPPARHIHLMEARYVHPAGFTPGYDQEGMLWRGRLSEVAGWSLGFFGPGQ